MRSMPMCSGGALCPACLWSSLQSKLSGVMVEQPLRIRLWSFCVTSRPLEPVMPSRAEMITERERKRERERERERVTESESYTRTERERGREGERERDRHVLRALASRQPCTKQHPQRLAQHTRPCTGVRIAVEKGRKVGSPAGNFNMMHI